MTCARPCTGSIRPVAPSTATRPGAPGPQVSKLPGSASVFSRLILYIYTFWLRLACLKTRWLIDVPLGRPWCGRRIGVSPGPDEQRGHGVGVELAADGVQWRRERGR